MEGYGYAIRSVSTYNVVRKEARGAAKFPFVSASSNSEGYVAGKKPVHLTGRPYDDDDDDHDDYKKHGFPTEAYPMKADDERHRQESPVPGSPRKIDQFLANMQNEASRPQRSSVQPKTDMHHSAQPNPYNSANGYVNYGSDKEGQRLFGGTNRNSSYDDPDGYGGDCNNKEGYKPGHSPIRNEKYNGYDGADNGYGDYGNCNKEGCRPISSPVRNDKYDGANKGYGVYGNNNKEGHKPMSSDRNGKYDGANKGYGGYGNYDSKEGYKPTSSPTRNGKYDGYDGANKGYDGYGNNIKEGYKPTSNPTRNGKYDGFDGANKGYGGYGNSDNKEGYKPTSSKYDGYNGANKGYGGYDNYNDKEGYKPTSDPPRNDNYGRFGGAMDPNKIIPGGLNKPKLGTAGTTTAPRKGIQLTEAINDIEKVIGLLKEASINDHSNNGGRKTTDTALPYGDVDNYLRKHDGVDKSAPRNNWTAGLGNDSRLGEPRGKFGNGMDPAKEAERRKGILAGPPQSQLLVPKSGMPNKNDFERKDATNFPSKPITHVIDGRVANYNNNIDRRPIIDSRLAEKKLGGTRI